MLIRSQIDASDHILIDNWNKTIESTNQDASGLDSVFENRQKFELIGLTRAQFVVDYCLPGLHRAEFFTWINHMDLTHRNSLHKVLKNSFEIQYQPSTKTIIFLHPTLC